MLNDTVPEVPEHFSVVLFMTTPLAGIVLTPDNATVVINDDDGEWSDTYHYSNDHTHISTSQSSLNNDTVPTLQNWWLGLRRCS